MADINTPSFRICIGQLCLIIISLVYLTSVESLKVKTSPGVVQYFKAEDATVVGVSRSDGGQLTRRRRDTSDSGDMRKQFQCAYTQGVFDDHLKSKEETRKSFIEEIELTGDSKSNLQLSWTGNDYERVIVVTGDFGSSTVYLSDVTGRRFDNITKTIEGSSLEGSELTLMKHPGDSKIVYLLSNSYGAPTSILYVSINGGTTFTKVPLSFLLTSPVLFHPVHADYALAVSEPEKILYVSKDKGLSWTKSISDVLQLKWSTRVNSSDIYAVTSNETDIFMRIFEGGGKKNNLMRTSDFGLTWKVIYSSVYTFGMEGKFLYTSAYLPLSESDERFLVVSTDGGDSWNHARVPNITPDRFYSILDSSEGQIFLHVDNPGDTGHGTLYKSDATGIIFAESLKNHLYPNFVDLTDFYKVNSMRGVYIASVLEADNSIHTVISYDRGGEWRQVKRPEGIACKDERQACYLQIHNLYSIQRGIPANPPLSVPNAVGLILVHGAVASSLQTTEPDVFVSSDGGYTFKLALEGPHHYQIADHGGLLVAIPSNTETTNVVKFSTDEGRCWIWYNFTTEKIIFTGLLIEPGNRADVVAIWGYTEQNRTWHTYMINFRSILEKQCEDSDYEEWVAHVHNGEEGCLLGSKDSFRRLKANSWCYNGRAYQVEKTVTHCACTTDDFDCDYGYYRKSDGENCIKDPNVNENELDVCENGHEEQIVPHGYHKIPGDTCVGGVTPPEAKLVNLAEICGSDNVPLATWHGKKSPSDPMLVGEEELDRPGRTKAVILGLCTVIGGLVVIIFVTFIAKKYRVYRANRKLAYRYSSIKCEDDGYEDAGLESLRRNTSLYVQGSDDESSSEQDVSTTTIPKSTIGHMSNGGVANGQLQSNGSTAKINGHAGTNGNLINIHQSVPSAVFAERKVSNYRDDSDEELLK